MIDPRTHKIVVILIRIAHGLGIFCQAVRGADTSTFIFRFWLRRAAKQSTATEDVSQTGSFLDINLQPGAL